MIILVLYYQFILFIIPSIQSYKCITLNILLSYDDPIYSFVFLRYPWLYLCALPGASQGQIINRMYNLYGGSKYTSKSFTRDSTPILLVEAVQCSPGLNPTAILLKGISTVLPRIETSHQESNFFASTALTKGGTSCLYYLSLELPFVVSPKVSCHLLRSFS